MNRPNHTLINDQAAKAARWMHDEMERNKGVLSQDEAWKGVHEQFGADCAPRNENDCWLSKAVLTAFRKLTPDVIWDPAGKGWRQQRRNDALSAGARMLNSKSNS